MSHMIRRPFAGLLLALLLVARVDAQLAPEIGYVHPAGAAAGTTIDVTLGGYDWTPDTQVFVHDERVKLEIVGPPSNVLVPDPPYWFGAKGRGYAWPLPREFPARLTIPADMPPGMVRFQVANANGASPPGTIHIDTGTQVVEARSGDEPQSLPALPVTVGGQIRLIEEIDRYTFTPERSGPVTIEVIARRFGSMLHAMVKVTDDAGRVVLDRADPEGRDFAETFIAEAGRQYTLAIHDLDFAGDRSYVYRLAIAQAPRVAAAYPSTGKRGETRQVEFLGLGLATGSNQLESVTANVTFPADPADSFDYVLETPQGKSLPVPLGLSDHAELVRANDQNPCAVAELPVGVTASFAARHAVDRYTVALAAGEAWRIAAQSSRLDLELRTLDAEGKELAQNDDAAGSADPLLLFTAPSDGEYTILVTDRSGKSGTREANYRLEIARQSPGYRLTGPTELAMVLGAVAKLPLKVERLGGFAGPLEVALENLPPGVTVTSELKFAENANDLMVDLAVAENAAAVASLVKITASANVEGQTIQQTARPVLMATIMKPRIKIMPEGLDDVRKVSRGSTFLAPLHIERLEGYEGEVVLEMTAKQQRHRQGLASDEFTVPADATRVEYPIFVPEWMETTKTSRMILNGSVRVPDPQGNMRTLLQRQELRIGILPEGALMKLSYAGDELTTRPGQTIALPLALSRATTFQEEARIELVAGDGGFEADPIVVTSDDEQTQIFVRIADDAKLVGEHTITLRATALKDQRWPVISETTIPLVVTPVAASPPAGDPPAAK